MSSPHPSLRLGKQASSCWKYIAKYIEKSMVIKKWDYTNEALIGGPEGSPFFLGEGIRASSSLSSSPSLSQISTASSLSTLSRKKKKNISTKE